MTTIAIAVSADSLRRDSIKRKPAALPLGQSAAFIHAKKGFVDADVRMGAASPAFMHGRIDHDVTWVHMHLAGTSN